MNVGLFTDTYFPQINGVGTSVNTLAITLKSMGHNVYIFTPKDPNENPDQKEDKHIIRMPSMPCIFINKFRIGLVYSPYTLSKIVGLKLDIIHTQTEFSLGLFGKILSRVLKIPMVHTYHTMYEDYVHYIVNGALITPSMAKEVSRLFCNAANAVIAPTDKVKTTLNNYGVIRPVTIIPTGINIDKFRKSNFNQEDTNNLKLSLGLSPLDPVILYLGRVAKEKSIDVIIKSLPNVLKKIPNTKLVIVGDGPYLSNLKSLATSLNINDSIIFTGSKPWNEIGKYYQLGDIFVSASITETQGLTFIEAMSAGLMVIAKKDDSILGFIKDRETGIIFSSDDELSEKICESFNNKELRQKIIETGTTYVEDISARTFANKVFSLYEDIYLNPCKYGYHKHIFPSAMNIKLGTARLLKTINTDISADLSKTSKIFKSIISSPRNIITARSKSKLENKEKQ